MDRSIRPLAEGDNAAWRALLQASYGPLDPTPDWREQEWLEAMRNGLGVFVGGRMVAGLHLHPYRIYLGPKAVPCGGIGAVASHPDTRRQGHAFALLKDTLKRMKDSGRVISNLFPFSYAFYRRLGWEHVGDQVHYELKFGDLPLWRTSGIAAAGRTKTVSVCEYGQKEQVDDGAIAALDAVYRKWASHYNGMLERTESQWRRNVLRPYRKGYSKYATVWEDPSGLPAGYVVYNVPAFTEPDHDIIVRELAATSGAAYRAILGFLKNQEAQFPGIKVDLPPPDPLLVYLANPQVKRELKATFMARLVDVPRALEATACPPPGLNGTVILSVDDPVCDWNKGDWLLAANDGRLTVSRVADANSEKGNGAEQGGRQGGPRGGPIGRVKAAVTHLAQIAFGSRKASALWQTDHIEAIRPGAVEFLDAAFGTRSPYISDYF
ncbi:MAG: GNAT family N-acetyltransferase [Bacillota bacterium]|nr:MAG: GNAT family N-acetyltransferase [Bacillota bacterium]